MTAGDFMKLLDETDSVILSKKLFKELLDNQKLRTRHGTWILSDARMKLYMCDACKYQLRERFPFCPWCAAEMNNPCIEPRIVKEEVSHDETNN